jgi:hypothetical protein
MDFISKDKRTINLPVPLGATVYMFITSCNDACMFQKDKFNAIFPLKEGGRCNKDMPCHTKFHSIRSIVLSLPNLDWILKEWQATIFETENEARIAGERFVETHKRQLLELGLELE